MAKRQTPIKPPVALPAPALIAALTAASFDGLRDAYLATVTWPAEMPDEAKVLAVEHVNGFIAHLVANAEAAGLVAKPAAASDPEAAEYAAEVDARLSALATRLGCSYQAMVGAAVEAGVEVIEKQLTSRSEAGPAVGDVEVVVTGPREGRRRLGRGFTEVASAPFFVTADELAQLEADPKLLVQRTGKAAD